MLKNPKKINTNGFSLIRNQFAISLSLIIITFIMLVVFKENIITMGTRLNYFLFDKFYFIFVICIILTYFVLAFILLNYKLGNYKLGGEKAIPHFNTFQWYVLCITSGVSTGFVLYSVYSPIANSTAPLFYNTPKELKGLTVTFFNWTFPAFAFYSLSIIPLAYYVYKKGLPCVPSTYLSPLIGKHSQGKLGDFLNGASIAIIIVSICVTTIISVNQIAYTLNTIFGFKNLLILKLLLLILIISISFLAFNSHYIKWILTTSILAIILLIFIYCFYLFTGPTYSIANNTFSATNQLFVQSPKTFFELGKFRENFMPYLADSTFFIWTWFCAWTVFMATFVTRISYGRRLRELVFATFIVPSIVLVMWFGLFGTIANQVLFQDPSRYATIMNVPELSLYNLNLILYDNGILYYIINLIMIFLLFLFFITTFDVGLYVINSISTEDRNMFYKNNSIIFYIIIFIITVFIITINSEHIYKYLNNIIILSGFPLVIILTLGAIGFIYQLYKDSK